MGEEEEEDKEPAKKGAQHCHQSFHLSFCPPDLEIQSTSGLQGFQIRKGNQYCRRSLEAKGKEELRGENQNVLRERAATPN